MPSLLFILIMMATAIQWVAPALPTRPTVRPGRSWGPTSFSPQDSPHAVIPVSQQNSLRLRGGVRLAQGHSAGSLEGAGQAGVPLVQFRRTVLPRSPDHQYCWSLFVWDSGLCVPVHVYLPLLCCLSADGQGPGHLCCVRLAALSPLREQWGCHALPSHLRPASQPALGLPLCSPPGMVWRCRTLQAAGGAGWLSWL